MAEQSLQDRYAPEGICFGCGPANSQGLRIKSFVRGEEVHADWTPQPHHAAFPGVLNGGIIGSLLDCHSNWTAAWRLMRERGASKPPCTVMAEYAVNLSRPAPTGAPVHLQARVIESSGNQVSITATLSSGGLVCATCRGVFVAVKPGHPAYHGW